LYAAIDDQLSDNDYNWLYFKAAALAANAAAKQGVAEGSDKTAYPNATVIKSKNGRPIGEIYQDEPYGWGCFHYGADNGADSMSSKEQALAQLKDMHDEYRQQGMAEGEKKGLYYNVNKRKAAGTSRPASNPKAPTDQAWKDAAKTPFTAKPVRSVKEAQELVAMLKVAGIDTKQLEEAIEQATQVRGIPVHKPVTPPVTDFGSDNDEEGDVCPECDGAGCPECYGDEHRDHAHDHAQGMERESAGMAEGRMSEIDMLYQDWVNSEYAPFDSDSGNENLVIGKAQQFLRGKVNPAEIEDIADIMSSHWHGGRGVMGEGLNPKIKQLIDAYRELYPKIAYDENGEELMEPEEAHEETCYQLGCDPSDMDEYFDLEDEELDETDLANAPNEKYDTIDATIRTGDADSTGAHRNFRGSGDNLMQQPPNVPALPVRSVKEAILSAEYESIKKASK
jgi:hypothetical protein